ncbi:hypothetical protein FAGAP_3086 [Fusarium agapanthi]|uniref:Uncharacterized protein n=1 Tax=Fusarium agapanthi TaxID=1803897 RepID=A0A9P5EGV7_9HYPO|nr:hypothetical protein FAGAP_3086 [Fusarium agapanthi]
MHLTWTLFTLLLASSAPTVLGGKCNAPREAGENKTTAWEPAGGAGAPCYTGCTTRNQQYCAGYCMRISNCDDCIKSLKEMGAAGSDEKHKETCRQEGDSYYCNCDS